MELIPRKFGLTKNPKLGMINHQLAEFTLLSIATIRFNLRLRLIALELTTEEFETILNFFGGLTLKQRQVSQARASTYYSLKAPDVCANCFTQLGTSIGGRVRNGCPYCRTSSCALQDDLTILKVDSGLPSNEVEFYLSKLLVELFHS